LPETLTAEASHCAFQSATLAHARSPRLMANRTLSPHAVPLARLRADDGNPRIRFAENSGLFFCSRSTLREFVAPRRAQAGTIRDACGMRMQADCPCFFRSAFLSAPITSSFRFFRPIQGRFSRAVARHHVRLRTSAKVEQFPRRISVDHGRKYWRHAATREIHISRPSADSGPFPRPEAAARCSGVS